jgi:hypothetical protein
VAVFGVLSAGLMRVWFSLTYTGLNTTTYAQRQNDQMRVLDYLKRDLRRATKVEIYNGTTLVTGTSTFGSELRLTIPDYYTDVREEDDANGTSSTAAPTVTSGTVSYGTNLTVRYYASSGAAVRNEAGTVRTVGSATAAFALSFKWETSGAVRCRVFFDQPLAGQNSRTLRRQVDALCVPRYQFQL